MKEVLERMKTKRSKIKRKPGGQILPPDWHGHSPGIPMAAAHVFGDTDGRRGIIMSIRETLLKITLTTLDAT
jgi:hypothetical protein